MSTWSSHVGPMAQAEARHRGAKRQRTSSQLAKAPPPVPVFLFFFRTSAVDSLGLVDASKMAESKSKREVNPVAEMENWKVAVC